MDRKNEFPGGGPDALIGLEVEAQRVRMTLPEIMNALAIDTMHVQAGGILADQTVETLTIDFNRVSYFEEEILGVLLNIRAAMLRLDGRSPESLVLQNIPEHLRQAFSSVQLEKFFGVQDAPVDAET